MIHHLKCWPAFFDAIQDGSKTFELRLDDRGFQKGDELLLLRTLEEDNDRIEWTAMDKDHNPLSGAEPKHTLRRAVTYCLHGPRFGLAPGWVIMSLAALNQK